MCPVCYTDADNSVVVILSVSVCVRLTLAWIHVDSRVLEFLGVDRRAGYEWSADGMPQVLVPRVQDALFVFQIMNFTDLLRRWFCLGH
jgi:hypothetical protein